MYELLHQFGIVGNRLVAGDHANGVGIAGNAVIRFGKAVELRTVHVGLHTLPSGIETTEISLVAGQRLERGRADGHLVEFALTSVRLNHATDHRIGFVGSERGESLAVEILRGFDFSVGSERTPDGAWLLLYLQHLLDGCALNSVRAYVGEIRQCEVGHAVVYGLFGTGLCHGHDINVKTCLFEITLVFRHIYADMIGVGRPGQHEGHFGQIAAARCCACCGIVALSACGNAEQHGDCAEECDYCACDVSTCGGVMPAEDAHKAISLESVLSIVF